MPMDMAMHKAFCEDRHTGKGWFAADAGQRMKAMLALVNIFQMYVQHLP